jgi:predicted cupin superfamily sugar epimerase
VPTLSADEVIALLGLAPHPEGGYFAEVFRSSLGVASGAHLGGRAASTAIYFLLKAGELSALHRVRSDEVWHHYAGDALELHAFAETQHTCHRLGRDLSAGERPMAVIAAGVWQAARVPEGPIHGYALVGCTVAPGFDFADFELPSREDMLHRLPAHAEWVRTLTRA